METVTDYFGGAPKSLQVVTVAIKRCLLLGRKAMTNLDSILKSRDITLLTKVCLVKAMVFPVVMYGCESWTINTEMDEMVGWVCFCFVLFVHLFCFLDSIYKWNHTVFVFVWLLSLQGTLKSLPQHQSSKASILWCSAFFIIQLSHPYMTTGKTIALTTWIVVNKVMSRH